MSPGGIRLRLTIRRHAVPDLKLVWPCVPSDDLTIAKLLIQVNEVIPLEGGEWGLEDYVLELGDANGPCFECLHFQLVTRILKDEDQVLIRPLLSDDLKRRRLSGRHQISNGGKHLVDGIAFGRAWLHAPGDRPALELPPRKRARLTYDTDDGDDESDDDGDWDADEPSDDEDGRASISSNGDATGDSSHAEDNSEELLDELKLLKQDRKDISEHSSENGEDDEIEDDYGDIGYGLLPTLDCMAALRLAFPAVEVSRIEKELRRQGYDVRDAYDELSSTFQASLSFDQMMDSAITGTTRMPGTPHFSEMESLPPTTPTRPLIQEIESEEFADDGQDSQDETSSSGSSEESEEEAAADSAGLGIVTQKLVQDVTESLSRPNTKSVAILGMDDSEESSSESDSESSSESSFSSGSESDSSSDSAESSIGGGAPTSNRMDNASSSSSDSSSSDSSSDESDAAPEVALTKRVSANKALTEQPAIRAVSDPEMELTQTQKRNLRRRRAKQARLGTGQNGETVENASPADDSVGDDFMARKAALLEALNTETPRAKEAPAKAATPAGNATGNTAEPSTNGGDSSAQTNGTTSDSPRRMRVNLGAGRRLLFGALGLKNPKSKADEDKLRENVMKDVRPHTNTRLVEEVQEPAVTADAEMLDDSWRQKINYRAVECCYDGIVLSEPPFPFVQRWDPQQNYNAMRKRKRQSEQSYYEEYEGQEEYGTYAESEPQSSRKKSKRKSQLSAETGAAEEASTSGVNKDDALGSSPATDADDLPSLPADVTVLPTLTEEEAKPGMVVTWRQLAMSKATNWQPQITTSTGLVVARDDDGIHVMLAKRDREVPNKLYDENTGKRIYEKFETPGSDDEDEEEDDGRRTLAWDEMMEPRIVQGEPPAGFTGVANGHGTNSGQHEVSERDMGSHVEPELDTQTLRAEVQTAIAHLANGEEDSSASIHSAQRPYHFDMPLADDGLMSVASDSWDASKSGVPHGERRTRSKRAATASQTGSTGFPDREQDTAADQTAVANLLSGNFASEGVKTRAAAAAESTNSAGYDAVIPSSQPEVAVQATDGGAVDAMPALDEDLIPETLPGGMKASAAEQDWITNGAGSGSSSPFPSLEEIFLTASTSREPPQSAPTTRTEITKHVDEEYEEAMRQLDNSEASDGSTNEPQNLFPHATQPARTTTVAVELPAGPPEPRSSPRGKRKAPKGKKFSLPESSQVISLSSSPPLREEYALDEEDETYTPTRSKRRKRAAGSSQKSNTATRSASQTRRGSSNLRQFGSDSIEGDGSQRAKLRRRSSVTR